MLSLMSLCAAQEGKTKSDAKAKPDFNGDWMIDKSKSDYGRLSNAPIASTDYGAAGASTRRFIL
jgi:hypothetical protein